MRVVENRDRSNQPQSIFICAARSRTWPSSCDSRYSMAVRINLDRVKYREPRMREIRWSICSSIRKQTIRFWIIGLQFLPWIVNAAFGGDFILFSNTGIFGWRLVADRCNTPRWRQIVETAFMNRLAMSPSGQIRLPTLDSRGTGTPSHC
jgi:hypothetical protein